MSLAAALLVSASLVGFTIVTARARGRAEREAIKAQTINEFMRKTLLGEVMTGIQIQNDLGNMSNAGNSAARSRARSGTDSTVNRYNQQQQNAVNGILP